MSASGPGDAAAVVEAGGDGVEKTPAQLQKEAKRLEKLAKFEAKKTKVPSQPKEEDPEVNLGLVGVVTCIESDIYYYFTPYFTFYGCRISVFHCS